VRSVTAVALILLAALPVAADGEPCFLGAPSEIVAVSRSASDAIELQWTGVAGALWYEVMRCDASGGPCSLLSLTTTETLSIADIDSESSSHFWYRIIARTGSPADLCAHNEYCSLPDGQCAGEGQCSPYSEFCHPEWEDPVCSCGNRWFLNPCFSSAAGTNIRWWGSCAP